MTETAMTRFLGGFNLAKATNDEIAEYIAIQQELFVKHHVDPNLVYRCEIQLRPEGAVLVDRKELLNIDYDNDGRASLISRLSRTKAEDSGINNQKRSKYHDRERNGKAYADIVHGDATGIELNEAQDVGFSM